MSLHGKKATWQKQKCALITIDSAPKTPDHIYTSKEAATGSGSVGGGGCGCN